MAAESDDEDQQPTRAEIERMDGPVLLEFGTTWCGHCQALAPKPARLMEDHPDAQHIKIEDRRAKRLERSFGLFAAPQVGMTGHTARQTISEGKLCSQAMRKAESPISAPQDLPTFSPGVGRNRGES